MNATTKAETTALATLPPAARAAIALGSGIAEITLRELLTNSAGILAITNAAGRSECHAAYMVLKNARIAIEKTGTAATEDAKLFTKAVGAGVKHLCGITEAEEARLQGLRDGFDAAEKARKDAEIAAEVVRMSAITAALATIRQHGADAVLICKTAASTLEIINSLDALRVTDTIYQERVAEAVELKAETLAQMRDVLATRVEAERVEAQRLADIATDLARMAAEREELAKQRADAAERERLSKIEAERIANEQAATARKLEEQQAALDLAAQQQREQAAANLKADANARAEADRAAQAERDRVGAGVKAQLERQQADLARQRKQIEEQQAAADARDAAAHQALEDAAKVAECWDAAHKENVERDESAEVARLQAAAEQHLADARPLTLPARITEFATAPDGLLDAITDVGPSDEQIIEFGEQFDMEVDELVPRLQRFIDAARAGRLAVAA